jgi:hypothetical protein
MIRIGTLGIQNAAFLQGVNGTTIPGPVKPVVVNSDGQLGTTAAASPKAASVHRASRVPMPLRLKLRRLERQVRQLREQANR